MRALLGKLDGIPERVFLWVDAGLAALVVVAHGGALALTYTKPTFAAADIRLLASISLPIAALILLTAAAALIRHGWGRQILAIHGFALAASAAAAVIWALSLLVRGLPQGNFAWTPGLMTACVGYSVFLASRYSVPIGARSRPPVFYAPLIAILIAVPIDLAVFFYFVAEMSKRFG